jgi:hypothetical protein
MNKRGGNNDVLINQFLKLIYNSGIEDNSTISINIKNLDENINNEEEIKKQRNNFINEIINKSSRANLKNLLVIINNKDKKEEIINLICEYINNDELIKFMIDNINNEEIIKIIIDNKDNDELIQDIINNFNSNQNVSQGTIASTYTENEPTTSGNNVSPTLYSDDLISEQDKAYVDTLIKDYITNWKNNIVYNNIIKIYSKNNKNIEKKQRCIICLNMDSNEYNVKLNCDNSVYEIYDFALGLKCYIKDNIMDKMKEYKGKFFDKIIQARKIDPMDILSITDNKGNEITGNISKYKINNDTGIIVNNNVLEVTFKPM